MTRQLPDRDEVRPGADAIHAELVDHVGEVLGAARVLHVEEDRAPAGGPRPLGLGWRHARGERALDIGDRERQGLGLFDDLRDARTRRAREPAPRRPGDGGAEAAFRLPRPLDAAREGLPRVFLRLPSRLELVVTVATV